MDLSTRQGRREQGQRIQRAVERAGLSIEELAGRIGCSRALIYQYLSGTTLAQPDRLQQIAERCGVPLTYFYVATSDGAEENASGPDSGAVAPPAAPADVSARLADSLRTLQELADALESPPDYHALAATCERILSLAAQLQDRGAQARAQERLGNALLMSGDNLRAADALSRAVTLSVETSDIQTEAIARQSLGKALWAMGRVPEAREQFEHTATGPVYRSRWRGLLSLGSIHEQYGEYREAMQRFDEAAAILEEDAATHRLNTNDMSVGLLYVNTNRRNVYLAGGDFVGARALGEKCLADAESLGNAAQHLSARFDIAWCDLCVGRWTSAYLGLFTALQLARFVSDQARENLVRAWMGIFLAAAGDQDAAIAYGKDALSMALSRGDRQAELYSQLALADAYTAGSQRSVEARYHTNQALGITTSVRYTRSEIECRLRLARLSAQDGHWEDVFEASTRAVTLAQELGARHLESLAHYWLGEALNHAPGLANSTSHGVTGRADIRTTGGAERPGDSGQEASKALAMALDIEFVETQWRSHDLLARIALGESVRYPSNQDSSDARDVPAPNYANAERHLRAALTVLGDLRTALLAAGIPDTLLENGDCQGVYERLALLLYQTGRSEEAVTFLDEVGWPPLSDRMARQFATLPNGQ